MTDSRTSPQPSCEDWNRDDDDASWQGYSVEFTLVLSLYGVVGFVGNVIVLIVYGRRRGRGQLSQSQHVSSLAVVDVTICCVVIPYTLAFERRAVRWDSVCRGLEVLRHTLVNVSNLLLMVIAVERYWSVFRPWRLVTVRRNRMTTALVFVCGVIIGAPAATIFSVTSTPHYVTSISRHRVTSSPSGDSTNVTTATSTTEVTALCPEQAYCRFTTVVIGQTWALVYQSFLAAEFFVVMAIIVVLYAKVYRQIWTRFRQRKKIAPHKVVSPTCFSVAAGNRHKVVSPKRFSVAAGNWQHVPGHHSMEVWITSASGVFHGRESGDQPSPGALQGVERDHKTSTGMPEKRGLGERRRKWPGNVLSTTSTKAAADSMALPLRDIIECPSRPDGKSSRSSLHEFNDSSSTRAEGQSTGSPLHDVNESSAETADRKSTGSSLHDVNNSSPRKAGGKLTGLTLHDVNDSSTKTDGKSTGLSVHDVNDSSPMRVGEKSRAEQLEVTAGCSSPVYSDSDPICNNRHLPPVTPTLLQASTITPNAAVFSKRASTATTTINNTINTTNNNNNNDDANISITPQASTSDLATTTIIITNIYDHNNSTRNDRREVSIECGRETGMKAETNIRTLDNNSLVSRNDRGQPPSGRERGKKAATSTIITRNINHDHTSMNSRDDPRKEWSGSEKDRKGTAVVINHTTTIRDDPGKASSAGCGQRGPNRKPTASTTITDTNHNAIGELETSVLEYYSERGPVGKAPAVTVIDNTNNNHTIANDQTKASLGCGDGGLGRKFTASTIHDMRITTFDSGTTSSKCHSADGRKPTATTTTTIIKDQSRAISREEAGKASSSCSKRSVGQTVADSHANINHNTQRELEVSALRCAEEGTGRTATTRHTSHRTTTRFNTGNASPGSNIEGETDRKAKASIATGKASSGSNIEGETDRKATARVTINASFDKGRELLASSEEDRRRKAAASMMLFICTLIYLLTWLPFWVDIFRQDTSLLFRYTFLLGHATNPLVYGVVNARVRQEIRQLFRP